MILNSRKFILQHQSIFKKWIIENKVDQLENSYQKFEWNAHGETLTILDKLISFRGSGIRVKRQNASPTLIALTATQVPIVHTGSKNKAKKYRYITYTEALKLQGFNLGKNINYVPENKTLLYRSVGNAVNVNVITNIMRLI